MAKDGTNRGGARLGSGPKHKAKAAEIEMRNFGARVPAGDLPPMQEYMTAEQADGYELQTERIRDEIMGWLEAVGCRDAVYPGLIEQYVMTRARLIQCEEEITRHGLTAPHPTTGAMTASPLVREAQDYTKLLNQIWYQIWQIVQEHGESLHGEADDPMEQMLST